MKTRQINWGKQQCNYATHRFPTDEEAEALVKMFEECHWCNIRDILIDSGITDESFPYFYYNCDTKNLQTFKLKNEN